MSHAQKGAEKNKCPNRLHSNRSAFWGVVEISSHPIIERGKSHSHITSMRNAYQQLTKLPEFGDGGRYGSSES